MNKVALIDADSLLYKGEEDLTVYMDRIEEIFNNILHVSKADHYKIFIESPKNYTFRKIMNKTYKINRKNTTLPVNYHEIKNHIIETYDPAIAVGIESDDYIISTYKYLKENHPLTEIVICANDKDYLTYPIQYMDLYYGRMYQVKKISEKEAMYNFAIQMLMGDGVDGVKCLSGVGEKTAKKLIKNCNSKLDYLKVIWREYRKQYKHKTLAKQALHNNFLMLKIRDDVRFVEEFIPINQE